MAAARQQPAIGRGCCEPRGRALYDAFVNSRASRVDLPLLSPAEARNYCATVRNKALDTLDALPDDDRTQAAFDFGLVISHENQHDETMLQALNLRTGPAAARSRDAAAGGPARAGGHVGAGARRPVRPRRRRGDRAALAGQRAARARRRRARVPDRPRARSPTASGGSSSTTAATTSSAGGRTRGWEHRQEAGLTRTAVLERRTAPAPGSATSRTSPPTSRSSTSRTSKPRRTRRGRERGCPPRWNGRRRAPGIPPPVARRRFPWGASEPTGASGEPRR